ncbi:MAG: Ig-like domain repeat protein [Chloroflexi bacterium]|nr:Ig-like domain repeat protein [Chloroflexota bacterium]
MISRRITKKRTGRKLFTGIAILALVGGVLGVYATALAVHDTGVFELDRNALNDSGAGEDWNLVCPTSTPVGIAPGCLGGTTATVSSFITDPDGATIFTGGGSKDDLDISNWRHTNGSVPDKDELHQGMAARYDTADQSLLYFAADRNAANGDAQMAVWFFQSAVGPVTGGTFSGAHQDGDILVLSDFTKGGGLPTVRVFQWNGPGGDIAGSGAINGTLDILYGTTATPQDCVATVLTEDPACATVNAANTNSPWAFQAKSAKAPANVFIPGTFYEGGIDLTFLGLGDECFSSFLIETRSSQSVDAVLKDFVGGSFQSCGAGLATQVSDDEFEIGGSVMDDATVTVIGGPNPPAPTGDVTFTVSYNGGTPEAVSVEALSGAVRNGNAYTVTSDSYTPTAAGDYCFSATWPGDTNYTGSFADDGTNECFTVTPKQPGITTTVNDAGPIDPGTELWDTAELTGTADPSNGVGGTITFVAYLADRPDTCENDVYTSTVSVTGDGSYDSRDGDGGVFAPIDPGNYNWIATYTPDAGDVNNLPIAGICGDEGEGSVVQQFNPTLTTAQTWTVSDTVTIDPVGGGDLEGTVYFELRRNSCDGTLISSESIAVTGGATTASSTAQVFTDDVTLWWVVWYSSENPAQTDIATSCKENSVLEVNN